MELLNGVISEYSPTGEMTIRAQYRNIDKFFRCGYKTVRILLQDNRRITTDQRKKIYVLLSAVADCFGEYPEVIKEQLKLEFRLKHLERMVEDFSLSDCPEELASDFLDFLVAFVLEWDVPLSEPAVTFCKDIQKYVYACLQYKKCAVCGQRAELHHVDAVGMGNDRQELLHKGLRALSLCRKHHTEAHTLGTKSFAEKYHLEPVVLDDTLCKVYRLKAAKP